MKEEGAAQVDNVILTWGSHYEFGFFPYKGKSRKGWPSAMCYYVVSLCLNRGFGYNRFKEKQWLCNFSALMN